MNKHSGYETYHSPKPPFVDLVAPTEYLAEGVLAMLTGFGRYIGAKIGYWHKQMVIARTAAELSRLSDHILDDIGVRRDDIHRVARIVVENPHAEVRSRVSSQS